MVTLHLYPEFMSRAVRFPASLDAGFVLATMKLSFFFELAIPLLASKESTTYLNVY